MTREYAIYSVRFLEPHPRPQDVGTVTELTFTKVLVFAFCENQATWWVRRECDRIGCLSSRFQRIRDLHQIRGYIPQETCAVFLPEWERSWQIPDWPEAFFEVGFVYRCFNGDWSEIPRGAQWLYETTREADPLPPLEDLNESLRCCMLTFETHKDFMAHRRTQHRRLERDQESFR